MKRATTSIISASFARRRFGAPFAHLFVFCLLAACGRGAIEPGKASAPEDPCGGAVDCPTSIDKAVRDPFTCRLTTIEYADDVELCRRLYVDLTGVLPSAEEYTANCKGKKVADMVGALMATEDYVTSRKKYWAERFGYNDSRTWYQNIIQLDALVDQLYRGKLSFSDFVAQAAVHPGLTSVDESDGRVNAAMEALLMRDATLPEVQDLANLYRVFQAVQGVDPKIPDFKPQRVEILPCRCAGPLRSTCQQSQLVNPDGSSLDVTLPLRDPSAANCQGDPLNSFLEEEATSDEQVILLSAGDVLKQSPDLYSRNAAAALQRYLGYDAVALIDTLGPSLGAYFRSKNSMVALETEIFTSVLYRESQFPKAAPNDCNGKPSPLFAGPRKKLSAEPYLASIAKFTGHAYGVCDYRFQAQEYARHVPGQSDVPSWAPSPPTSQYPVLDANTNQPDFTFRDKARAVGGCADRLSFFKNDDRGAYSEIALDRLTREACEDPAASGMIPSGYSGDVSTTGLQSIATFQFQRALLAAPASDELTASVAAMQSCLTADMAADGTPTGVAQAMQCTAQTVPRRFCSALLKSARFSVY